MVETVFEKPDPKIQRVTGTKRNAGDCSLSGIVAHEYAEMIEVLKVLRAIKQEEIEEIMKYAKKEFNASDGPYFLSAIYHHILNFGHDWRKAGTDLFGIDHGIMVEKFNGNGPLRYIIVDPTSMTEEEGRFQINTLKLEKGDTEKNVKDAEKYGRFLRSMIEYTKRNLNIIVPSADPEIRRKHYEILEISPRL